MSHFFRLLLLSSLLIVVVISCSDSEDDSDLLLSIEPLSNLAFSAAATESFDIAVTTNQSLWDATSDQEWCLVIKTKGKFMVEAIANSSAKAPAKAIITVTAGRAKRIQFEATQSGLGASLSVLPNVDITLSHDGAKEVELEVSTNQQTWSAISSQRWCSVSRGLTGFTVKGDFNSLSTSRQAIITVSAGDAANVTIMVTQFGEGEGSMIDNGTTIWNDTHWRLFSLLGKPKSVAGADKLIEFSANGRLTYDGHPKKTSYGSVFEYDSSDRLSKNSYSESGASESLSYEYGNHKRYVPSLTNLHNTHNGINMLAKGLSAVSHTDSDGVVSRFEFTITNREVITDFINNAKYIAAYSDTDNHPINSTLTTIVDGNSRSIKQIFKYGTNRKYSEVVINSGDGGYVLTTKYNPVETIYLLPISEAYTGTDDNLVTMEYDDEFRLVKSTDGATIRTYSDYKIDNYGNWTERKVNGVAETRTIEYH